MPTFETAVASQFAPKAKSENTGVRKAAFEAILAQVAPRVGDDVNDPNRPALVVRLDESDKPLTVSNQIKRAATRLGIEMYVRRSGNEIRAYKTGSLTPEAVAEAAPAKRGRKAKASTAS